MSNYNDWIMDRCGKITASEIYKIMGKGRNKDAYFGQLAETYYDNADDTSDCGYISYLLWGGKSALSWSRNKLRELGELKGEG